MKKLTYIILMMLIPAVVFCDITRKVTSSYPDGSPKEAVYLDNNKEIAKETYQEKGGATITGSVPDGKIKELNDAGKVIAEWNFAGHKRDKGVITVYSVDEEKHLTKDIEKNKLSASVKIFK